MQSRFYDPIEFGKHGRFGARRSKCHHEEDHRLRLPTQMRHNDRECFRAICSVGLRGDAWTNAIVHRFYDADDKAGQLHWLDAIC